MKPYEYFLFDWDGCLAKTLELWLTILRETYNGFGVFPPDRDIAHHFGDWNSSTYFGIKDVAAYNTRVTELSTERLKQVTLYPGAAELIHALKDRGKKVAVLSSSERPVLEQGIAHNKLDGLFDVVLSLEDVANHKPDPEVIEKGLVALGGNKADAIMIGDSRKDLGAAQNAGIDSALMYPPEHRVFYDFEVLKTYNPTYVFDGFEEFTNALG